MNRIIIRNYQSLVVQSAKMLDTNDDDIEDENSTPNRIK